VIVTIRTIDVRDLIGSPGANREATFSGTLEGLGTELAGVAEDDPIAGELLLESLSEGILVSGRLRGTVRCRCARCLKEFDEAFDVQVRELFVLEPDPDGDEYPLDPEGALDPEQMVRDAVGVELPFSPLHDPTCLGLCTRCGGDLNEGACTCTEPEIDPRWADLSALLEQLPADDQASRN
jgi:uncharacterized protein